MFNFLVFLAGVLLLLACFIPELRSLWSRIGALRPIAVGLAVSLTVFWVWFVLDSAPWIVPADHDPAFVKAYSDAAMSGLGLAVVSALSTVVATGIFGRTVMGWILGVLLLCGLAWASFGLYPSLAPMQLSPFRLPAQIAGGMVVILGTAVFTHKKQAEAIRS